MAADFKSKRENSNEPEFKISDCGEKVSYTFSVNGVELDRGNNFRPAPSKNIDDIQTMVSLLGFMCLEPVATDKEYFKDHLSEHLAWLDTQQRDDLNMLLYNFECFNVKYHRKAISTLTKCIELYPTI